MGKRKRQVMEEESSSGIAEQEVLKSLKDRTDVCQRLLDAVKRVKGKSGHPKYEFLCRLPSRRSNPEYYRVISEPISLSDIEQKLKTRVYNTVSLFVTDMVQMFNNAETFYQEGSQERDDARALHEEFSSELRCIVREEDAILSPENKKLKLKISGGKIVSDKESDSDTTKGKRRKHRSFSPSPSEHTESEGEGLIVQIKLPEQSESPASSETWKPKREKQRKDYAELFGQRKTKKISEEEKEIMLTIYNKIITEKDEDGEPMCEPFMVKPSARKYPHYYVLIKKPIDLQDIKEKIDNERYISVERFMADVNTLFRNAKFFNEETSIIYEHADLLYKVAKAELQQLTAPLQSAETSATPSPAPPTSEPASAQMDAPINPNVGALFDEIKMFTDSDGRALWQTFAVVPNKLVNLNYHNVIKQPMDIVTIAAKLLDREYDDVECIFNDFVLLFDNTCRYYKSGTTQYKDAVTLHKVLLRKREQLTKNQPCVPHVIKHVQEILIHLVKVVMYYKEPTSRRRLSSSVWLVSPLPDCKDEGEDEKNSVASVVDLVTIERRVVKGQYHRLDWLQDDIMSLLRHVQSTSTAGDQAYKDAVRLQQVYLQERDRLCVHGKLLWSPALSQYSLQELLQEEAWLLNMDDIIAEDVISQCLEECSVESDDDGLTSDDCRTYLEHVNFSGCIYSIGDVIYVAPKVMHTGGCLLHIVAVEKLWKTNSGDHWFSGSWFYRPEQTFHNPTKKFAKYEVFHSDCQQMVLLDRAVRKCGVLQYNDYCRNTVEGFDEGHTFVCREHYNVERKSFKPLKGWGVIGRKWNLLPREQPLNLEFEYSKFATQELITKLEESGATQPAVASDSKDNDETDLVEFHVEYDNVESKDQSGIGPGCHSYDQYCLDQYCFRLGDYVYLRSDEQQSFIARIERMWTDENGDPWFHGCWFLRPSETVHLPTHLFYPNELLMSNIADTNPMRSVIGKCAVLSFKEYCTWRPTELEEKDVYLCEERYNEHDKDFKKLKSLKKYIVSLNVVPDEVYYFSEEVIAHKEGSPSFFLAELPSTEPVTVDVLPTKSDVVNAPSSSSSIATSDHNNTEQKPPLPAAAGGGIQPVMLFALDLQSQLRNRGVQVAFTSVVEAAKNEWSKLSMEQQEDYQLRSTELLSVMPNTAVVPDQSISKPAKPATPPISTTPKSCYVCHWEGCGLQFADVAGLFAHVTELGPGSHIIKEGANDYYCEWKNCHRHKKSAGKRPFDTHTKLLRHLKEVHMSRAIKDRISAPQLQDVGTTRPATPTENMHTPTTRLLPPAFQTTPISITPAPVTMETNITTAADTVTTNTINSIPSISAHQQEDNSKIKETPQILHTTVYTRYLEGLRSNKQHFSNWHDSQTVQQYGMAQTPASLQPAKWISPKAVPSNKNITDALYQLRDHLLQDTAKLSKYLSSH